ncbi:MAG: ABC transporter ATP-binding protein [Methanobacteriota archaeon]
MPSDALLAATGLTKRFGGLTAVDDMSLAVRPGEIVALIGPNGAGKTTFFNLLSGALRPDAGRIRFAGDRIDGAAPHVPCRKGIARTFQIPRPLRRLSVLQNLLIAPKHQTGESALGALLRPSRWKTEERRNEARARETLAFLGLAELADEYAGALSGGQRKLLELGRALLTDPTLVLLDEPVAGVNPTLARTLMERVQTLRRERGLTFVLIEHDMQTVMANCDRIVVMDRGRLLAEGTPDEIRANRQVIDAYLGG